MRRLWLLPLAAVGIAVAVGVALLARGGEDDSRQTTRRMMLITTSISPRVHLFGDPLVAEVRLLFDPDRVRSDDIRIDAVFDQYSGESPKRSRRDAGDLTEVRYRYTLGCLTRACLPRGARRENRFPPVRVNYTLKEIRQRATAIAEWPSLSVASRLGAFDLQQARWRADLRRIPSPSYLLGPSATAGILFALALGLALAAGVMARRALVFGDAGVVEEEDGPTRSPLEQAIALTREACADGATGQTRMALERLARELELVGHAVPGAQARRLAWSPGRPSRGEVERLVSEVDELPSSER
jgi:hypothetical protein